MNATQYVIFEASIACQFAGVHRACPISDPRRWPGGAPPEPMPDALIVQTAVALYRDHGFTGMIGWHYYGEPAMARDRILGLMDAIEAAWPAARFTLWTNGLDGDAEWFRRFAQIVVSDYGLDHERREAIHRAAPWAILRRSTLDARRTAVGPDADATPCARMFAEMIFDYGGAVHCCCYDWRGQAELGRLGDGALDELIRRWRIARAAMVRGAHGSAAPPCCRRCAFRSPDVACLVPEIQRRAMLARDAILGEPTC